MSAKTPIASFLIRNRFAVMDNILLPQQCAEILEAMKDVPLQNATVVHHGKGHGKLDTKTRRTKQTSHFPQVVKEKLLMLEMQFETMMGTTGRQWEGWQFLLYEEGDEFTPHHDTGLEKHQDNERVYTVIVTLQEPKSGGWTEFPQLNARVPSVTGRGLVWCNLKPDGTTDTKMLHAGAPVAKGKKYCLVNWIHEKAYK